MYEKSDIEVQNYLIYRYKFRYSKKASLNFPCYIVIEPSSICNLRCAMCFQQDDILRTSKYSGVMNVKLFEKIIKEASNNGCGAVTIAGRGEPLLNKNIVLFIRILGEGNFFETKLNTNGSKLNDEIIHEILKASLSIVVFSNEAYNAKDYKKTRCGSEKDFEILIKNVMRFKEIKELYYPKSRTVTRMSGVKFDFIDKRKFFEFWQDKVDEVTLVDYEERKDTYNNKCANILTPCPRLWQRVYIWYDGSVSPCDIDYLQKIDLGSVNEFCSIKDIWNGEKFANIRNIQQNGQRKKIIPCDRCENIE